MHVIPKITLASEAGEEYSDEEDGEYVLDNSPENLCVVSEFDTFQKMVAAKTPAWTEKKRLLTHLKEEGKSKFGRRKEILRKWRNLKVL